MGQTGPLECLKSMVDVVGEDWAILYVQPSIANRQLAFEGYGTRCARSVLIQTDLLMNASVVKAC